jgi:hypothetical protein
MKPFDPAYGDVVEAPTVSPDFAVGEFLDWARTKPADERYCYIDPSVCALAQFGAATGRPYLIDIGRPNEAYPAIDNAVNPLGGAFTFGALVKRLEAIQ